MAGAALVGNGLIAAVKFVAALVIVQFVGVPFAFAFGLLAALAGLVHPSQGRVLLDGADEALATSIGWRIIDSVSAPLGNLLDIGCGEGRLLKLLASRANRVVGVDIDPEARRLARAQVLLAGLPNCSLRQGDMYSLPFDDDAFDTVILDDVLSDAQRPTEALQEAQRLLRAGGRMLMLASVDSQDAAELRERFAAWAAATDLRLAPPRSITDRKPGWLLGIATS